MLILCRLSFWLLVFCLAALPCRSSNPLNALSADDSLRIRNFVIRSYIQVLDSKPSKDEAIEICRKFSLFDSFEVKKISLIDTLLNNKIFIRKITDRWRFEYLQGLDVEQMRLDESSYNMLLTIKTQEVFYDFFKRTRDGIAKVLDAENDLNAGNLDFRAAEKRFFDCKFYDDINMGSHNTVTSAFNYLFFRGPTKYELEEAKKMIEGEPGILFGHLGNSKSDFWDIMFSSDAYVEGTVRYWYNKILRREPRPDEIFYYLTQSGKFDIKELIRAMLVSKDFAPRILR
jgi:hypothetical protein